MLVDVDPRGGHARRSPARLVQRGELGEHASEGLDEARVELAPAAALELEQAVRVGHGAAVRTPRRHRVVGVDDAHGLGEGRNGVAGEPVRVAVAVPALMVMAHGGHELGREQGPMMSALKLGCCRMSSHSRVFRRLGLRSTRSEMAILPMSCR